MAKVLNIPADSTTTDKFANNRVFDMEVQVIQARPQIIIGSSGRCEDCEEEERQDAIEEDIAQDRVNLSAASLSLAENSSTNTDTEGNEGEQESSESTSQGGPQTELQLTEEERRVLNELKARDAEVHAHEAAHAAAAGPYANGGPTFEYQTGPDGRQYATGGEVSIDASPVQGDPEATVRKAQTIKRAALAPREPSSQDRAVAAQAAQLESQARQEVQREKAEENKETRENNKEQATQSKPEVTGNSSEKQGVLDSDKTEVPKESPFTKRVINQFTPSTSISGNLLNIIS